MVENTLAADCDFFLLSKSTIAPHFLVFLAPRETIVCTIYAKKEMRRLLVGTINLTIPFCWGIDGTWLGDYPFDYPFDYFYYFCDFIGSPEVPELQKLS